LASVSCDRGDFASTRDSQRMENVKWGVGCQNSPVETGLCYNAAIMKHYIYLANNDNNDNDDMTYRWAKPC